MLKNRWYKFLIVSFFVSFFCSGFAVMQYKAKAPAIEGEKSNSFYFVASENGIISKVDGTINKIIGKIHIEGNPEDIKVSEDGSILGVTLSKGEKENGFILFYNIKNNQLLKKIEVGKKPSSIEFTPNNRYALVTNTESNSISVIDTENYTVLQSIPTGKGPKGFCISKNGNYGYVANTKDNTVAVIDILNSRTIKKIKVGKHPIDTAVTYDGKSMFVTLDKEKAIAKVDLVTEKVRKIELEGEPTSMYIQPGDKYVFAPIKSEEIDRLLKINIDTKEIEERLEIGKGHHNIDGSSDNKFIYVTNSDENTVSIIDKEENGTISRLNVDKGPKVIEYKSIENNKK